jgi:Mycothiol maleylpyruvate isomerase N-terminal domain.
MDLRYPIGKFHFDGELNASVVGSWIDDLERLPALLRKAVDGLDDAQLDTAYRPGGWTVRQVVHHLADSHMNAYVRIKLALTEDNPVVKPYDEARWAELPDSGLPVEPSLLLVDALHTRWTHLLRSLTPADWAKTFVHPDSGTATVGRTIGFYAWHGKHHTAHITSLRERMGWLA